MKKHSDELVFLRVASNEILEKLIESVARNLRENRQHQLTRKYIHIDNFDSIRSDRIFRMEILRTSTRDQHEELQTTRQILENLLATSDRELIQRESQTNSIDWRNISELSVRIAQCSSFTNSFD